MHYSILILASCLALQAVASVEKKIVCYFGSWSVYREGSGQFHIADIDASLCTHLIYTFALLKDNKIVSDDPWADLADGGGKNGYKLFTDLRKKNPSAKISIAIGGWNDSQGSKYSVMVSSAATRGVFVESVVAFVKKYDFDGFDVDWEYPTQNGGKTSDRANYVSLLKELRERLSQEGRLLSIAVAALEGTASPAYDIAQVSKYVDWINLMTYDFHGSWERKTGHHAALRGQLCVESAVKYWLSQGCDTEKLVVGVPTYGRAWTLSDPSNHGVGAPASGPGEPGPYTKERSMLGYNEICEMTSQGDWTVEYDEQAVAAFAFNGNQWVGYDNVKSVTEKANFIKKSGLGGAMIWSIETDDFRGVCGVKYPILKSLNAVLRKGEPVPEEHIPSPWRIQAQPRKKSETHNQIPEQKKNLNSGHGVCTQEGNIPDSCNYISCVPNPPHGFRAVKMSCPSGLCYNAAMNLCDWS